MEAQFGLVAESIDGPGIRIRRYVDEDVADVQAGCDDPLTQRFLPMLPSPYTHQDAVWWISEGSRGAFERGGGNFAIADPVSDGLLGGIGITHEQNGTGEIGYWVAPWGRGRAVATAATRTLTGYAFSAGYGRLHLRTEHENLASQRVAIAAGYAREGVQRGAVPGRNGGRHDLIVWSRLPDDPAGPVPRVLPDLPGARGAHEAGGLADGTVTLRPLGPEDATAFRALRSVADIATTSVVARGESAAPAPADLARYCARAGAQWLAGSRAHLTIRDSTTGALAGDICLFNVVPPLGQAMIGYAVDPAWRGRGIATRAVALLTRWALGDVGLARLVAGTRPDNAGSQRVLEKAGFTREGYERGHLPTPDGGRADLVTYALLAADLRDPGLRGRG